ncbi:hypothetical protein [Streptomyces sp. NPDC057623]|uniref:hypothetical protein n=1 Tax=Streptomyces sp. NPDC057623 TaxID=3346187 RepID=UPI0036A1D583
MPRQSPAARQVGGAEPTSVLCAGDWFAAIEELEAREAAARVRAEEHESKMMELTVRLEAEREAWSRLR